MDKKNKNLCWSHWGAKRPLSVKKKRKREREIKERVVK